MRTVKQINTLIDCGLGRQMCDLVLRNVQLVNVCSKEIYKTDIYIKDERIVSVHPGTQLCAAEEIDCGGKYALPGFIDAHVHLSSSMVNPEAFAQAIVPKGTTTICADFMEIANVTGAPVVDIMLQNSDNLPYRIAIEVPTRVPTAPGLETTGDVITAEQVKRFLQYEETVALGEIAPSKILYRTDDDIQKICDALNCGKIVNGHAVGCTPQQINVYASAGVTDDHECVEWEEALERLRCGMFVFIREGSAERNLPMFVENALKLGYSFENTCFCTDDKHLHDIKNEGHINHNVNLAIKLGVDPVTAIAMATYNAAKHFRMDADIGSITPGRYADIILCDDINNIQPQSVYFKGVKVFEDGKMPVKQIERSYPDWIKDTVKFKNPITAKSFELKAPQGASQVTVRLPQLVDDQIINVETTAVLPVIDGAVMCDESQDIMKMAVVERYGKNGNIGVYFVKGFTLKKGAVAYSMSHNHQNICAIGASDADIAVAVNTIGEMHGGLVTVIDGKVICKMPLAIAGLMSEETCADKIVEQIKAMNESAKLTGCTLPAPFMTLSFIGHPAVPQLAPTDMGLVDVAKQQFVDVIIG